MQVVEPGFETTGLICEKETSVGQGEEFGRMTPGSSQKPSNAIVIVCSSDHMMARLSDNTTASVNCMGLRYSCDDTSGQASKGSGSLALGGGGLTNVGAGGQDLLNPEGSPMSEPGDRIFSTLNPECFDRGANESTAKKGSRSPHGDDRSRIWNNSDRK